MKTNQTGAAVALTEGLGLAPKRDIVGELRHVVPEHGWAVVNTKTDGIVIWFSERREFHTERKARAWLQKHAETHRTHEVRPYEDHCLEHEAADEIERLRAELTKCVAAMEAAMPFTMVPAFEALGPALAAAKEVLGPNV